MTGPNNYRRPSFPVRPWIRNTLYDAMSASNVLHLDARLVVFGGVNYLTIDTREGGFKDVTADAYVIRDDPLYGYSLEQTWLNPAWRVALAKSRDQYWTRGNNRMMAGIHKRVLADAEHMRSLGRWSRVSVHCHYVRVTDLDTEPKDNQYKPPKAYKPRTKRNPDPLPDLL